MVCPRFRQVVLFASLETLSEAFQTRETCIDGSFDAAVATETDQTPLKFDPARRQAAENVLGVSLLFVVLQIRRLLGDMARGN